MPEDDVTIVVNNLKDALREARSFALCLERPRPQDVTRWQEAIDNAAEFLRPIAALVRPLMDTHTDAGSSAHVKEESTLRGERRG